MYSLFLLFTNFFPTLLLFAACDDVVSKVSCTFLICAPFLRKVKSPFFAKCLTSWRNVILSRADVAFSYNVRRWVQSGLSTVPILVSLSKSSSCLLVTIVAVAESLLVLLVSWCKSRGLKHPLLVLILIHSLPERPILVCLSESWLGGVPNSSIIRTSLPTCSLVCCLVIGAIWPGCLLLLSITDPASLPLLIRLGLRLLAILSPVTLSLSS